MRKQKEGEMTHEERKDYFRELLDYKDNPWESSLRQHEKWEELADELEKFLSVATQQEVHDILDASPYEKKAGLALTALNIAILGGRTFPKENAWLSENSPSK